MRKLLLLPILLFSLSCEPDEFESAYQDNSYPCGTNETNRVGAICNDGSRSSATGSGACSYHGGVDYWLCE